MSNPLSSSAALQALDPLVVKGAIEHLDKLVFNDEDIEHFIAYLNAPHIWREPMVSLDTFLDSKYYLGIGDEVFPEMRKQAKSIIDGGFQQAAVVAGIGAGKTTLSEILVCYEAHKLLCLRDPHKYFHMADDKPISIMNMGTSATQALDNAFAGIKKLISTSTFFKKQHPLILSGRIRFRDQNILLLSGNSKSTTALGYNIFCAVLDEAAFFLDTDLKNVAGEIYTAMQRRIVSRFGKHGLLIMISSPNYEGDFIMNKLEESKQFPNIIYSCQLPTWKCKPKDPDDERPDFYFNHRKGIIYDEEPVGFGSISRVGDPFDSLQEIWEIPGAFKDSFVQDPEKAKRDFAAVPSKSIAAFMPNVDLIRQMFTEEETPLQSDMTYIFPESPLRTNYYIHIDLALNRNGKGDHAGFAMVHFDGWELNEKTGENQKHVVVDLAERISAGPTGEIEFQDVRNRVYLLHDMGFNIKMVTLDSFQSADTMQKLKRKGMRSEYLSVDRTIEPYQTLKELIYTGSIKCHKSEILLEELSRLEISKSSKVDHAPGSSKDVADAVCGAVFSCIVATGSQIGMTTGSYYAVKDKKGNVLKAPVTKPGLNDTQKKIEYYQRLQSWVDRGIL